MHEKYIKPVQNPDGSFGQIIYDPFTDSTTVKDVHVTSPYTQVFDKPLPGLINTNTNTTNRLTILGGRDIHITGGSMPAVGNKVSYGWLVRIPTDGIHVGDRAYKDVTESEAKAEAKRLRKLARKIDKATR